ncbi:Lrp/AsnC family transcriptional regulator [Undibacterium jejuense]|uniref:Lrp/AsnC family transcriptional regulator n=1 Tax=Undibacterium jejuense TaxID=1344949 RepID=A0A923HKB2_9BURK|nr:Lrp/AsnC family transcriptional regulator [Undibacterium jejuense]MBC3863312.1 Lrp/AsnC family transcriptional regulator [Undibacterium jejuense]
MDKIDRVIIAKLRSDARMSYKELGEKIFLSANAVSERVRQLIAKKIILGFTTNISLTELDLNVQAIIDVKLATGTTAAYFESVIASIPGVLEATLMTGSSDYMLKVACTDQIDLMRLIESLRERAGVQDTYSRLILKQFIVQEPIS